MPCCFVEDSGFGDGPGDLAVRQEQLRWTPLAGGLVRHVSATSFFSSAHAPGAVLYDTGEADDGEATGNDTAPGDATVSVALFEVVVGNASELRAPRAGAYWRAAEVTAVAPQALIFELAAARAVAGLRTRMPKGEDGGAYDSFDIDYSVDGITWSRALTGRGDAQGCCNFQHLTFPTRTGRFWRFTIHGTHGGARPYLQSAELLLRVDSGAGAVPARALANVPAEARGATFFALSAGADAAGLGGGAGAAGAAAKPLRSAGDFVVVTQVPATLFLIAVDGDRPRRGRPGRYRSGFGAGPGWEELQSDAFVLEPWGLPMACWRRYLRAGERYVVPHTAELYGSVALLPLPA
eukprot:TRINITY_DN47724_c0_g1_i1.p1 TRINITY_DN47724_c0_g1~~TRINITY_DN47724_c0_g1_i1.p1  ORF type:complete len:351 (-),score=79.00 TRINITY_DN47724_c0_g1_i1:84-1136(-)